MVQYNLNGLSDSEQLKEMYRYLRNRERSEAMDGTQDPWVTDEQLMKKFELEAVSEEAKLERLKELLAMALGEPVERPFKFLCTNCQRFSPSRGNWDGANKAARKARWVQINGAWLCPGCKVRFGVSP